MESNRKSNFELLRIVCILMIIGLHYNNARMGGALGNVIEGTPNYYIVHFTESLFIVAVNVFILITGYFSYKKESVKVSKVIHLFYLCIVYGISIFALMLLTGNIVINVSSIKTLINTICSRWFVVIYIILYLLIPYINKLLNAIDKKQHRILLIILIFFFYIWPTFYNAITISDGGYGIINFVTLYLIGAYIAKYVDYDIKKYKTIGIYLLCAIITTLFSCYTSLGAYAYIFIFNLIGSIALFLTFKNLKIKNNKIINKLSGYVFVAYIIHENEFIRLMIYKNLFKTVDFYQSKYMVLHMIGTVICIFILCIIIEYIRRLIMKKLIDDKIEKIKYEIK